MSNSNHMLRIRIWLAVLIAGLVLSGITAFPLQAEMRFVLWVLRAGPVRPIANAVHLLPWIDRVSQALAATNSAYPFLSYGTDWLAFAHLVIAVAFIGPFVDPVRNKWLITFGLIACAGVIPLALIAGQVRAIPLGWCFIDCSFGVLAAVPLLLCRRSIRALERGQA